MAKRFKLRMSRVFQSCRSKGSSSLPSNPLPSFFPLTRTHHHHRNSLARHVSSAIISVGCGCRSRSTTNNISNHRNNHPHDNNNFHWEQQEKWHVVAKVYAAADRATTPRRKIYNSSDSGAVDDDGDVFSFPPPPRVSFDRKIKRRLRKKKTTMPRLRMSTSSADSCGLFFSDDGEGETETLISTSRSFSTTECSSSLDLEAIRENPSSQRKSAAKKKKKKNRGRRRKSEIASSSPARLSMVLRVMPCTVEGKVRESFAVVKRSEHPYEDFKRSMMEMILEKQMFEETDLEQLLHCFLSLNSTQHHAVILQAFADIWEALFATTLTNSPV